MLDAVEKGVDLSREELVGKARYRVIYGTDLSLATGRFEKTLNKNCFYRCKKAPQAEDVDELEKRRGVSWRRVAL